MSKFELIKDYKDNDELLPRRATDGSVGYDFFVAQDTVVPSILGHQDNMYFKYLPDEKEYVYHHRLTLSLDEMADLTKETKARPTLVPTGIKCKLDKDTYLQLSVRSSTPLKNWLILANGVGIIDRDYYDNPDNEGHIQFQLINLSPFDIQLKKGDRIGQGVILPYLITDDDIALQERYEKRKGGFGSTS